MRTKHLLKLYTYNNGIIPIVCTRNYKSTFKFALKKIFNFQAYWFRINKMN